MIRKLKWLPYILVSALMAMTTLTYAAVHIETFNNNNFKDSGATDANWDNALGEVRLNAMYQYSQPGGLDNWGGQIRAIHYDGSDWLVGGAGAKLNSYDGLQWTNLSPDLIGFDSGQINAIWEDGGTWLIGGTGKKLNSYNGTTFTDLSASLSNWVSQDINSINHGSGVEDFWLIVGNNGRINSYDGSTFTDLSGSSNYFSNTTNAYTVGFNGTYWLIGADNGNLCKYQNGNFTDLGFSLRASAFGNNSVRTFAWDGSRWLIGGGGGKLVSYNGSTFTDLSIYVTQFNNIFSLDYNSDDSFWTIVGNGTGLAPIVYTYNGSSSWYNQSANLVGFNSDQPLYVVKYGASTSTWLLGGEQARINKRTGTVTSTTYTNESTNTKDLGENLINTIATNGSSDVLLGGANASLNSYNGVTFSDISSTFSTTSWGTANVLAINGNGSYWLIGGSNGKLVSYNGSTMTDLSSSLGFTGSITSIHWNGTSWLIGGTDRQLASYNGSSFSDLDISSYFGSSDDVKAIASGGSIWMIGGDSGSLVSYDGSSFTSLTSGFTDINAIDYAYYNSTFHRFIIGGSTTPQRLRIYDKDLGWLSWVTLSGFSGETVNSLAYDQSNDHWFIGGSNATLNRYNWTVVQDWSNSVVAYGSSDIKSLEWNSEFWLLGGSEGRVNKYGPAYISPSTAQSTTISTAVSFFHSVTLTAIETLNGQQINYYLSGNGGSTWIAANKGSATIFVGVDRGQDLRWRAVLSTVNVDISPRIDQLTFEFVIPPTPTVTPSSTSTPTPTFSRTPTLTNTLSATPTSTRTPTYTPTSTTTPTYTPSNTPTITLTVTMTPTFTSTITPSITITSTSTSTSTHSPTATDTSTSTATRTGSPTITPTSTPSATNSPTGTATPTITQTYTPTHTPTRTATPTGTATKTSTATPTFTATPSASPSATGTRTITPSSTATITNSPTRTGTSTKTVTRTVTPTSTPSSTVTPSSTATPTITPSATDESTATPTNTPTYTHSPTSTDSPTATTTGTYTATTTPTFTPTNTPTHSPSKTLTSTGTPSATRTITSTPSSTATPTFTPTSSATPTETPTATNSPTGTTTSTPTSTDSPTTTATPTATHSPTPSSTRTPTPTVTPTSTGSPTGTPSATKTATPTPSASPTSTHSPTGTHSSTATPTGSPTHTGTPTSTHSPTPSSTKTPTPTITPTSTASPTATPSATKTPTPTATGSPTFTHTATPTATMTPSTTPTQTPTATPTEAVANIVVDAPTNAIAGFTTGVTVTAMNQWGSVATSYRGTVTFTSNDGSATLPVNYTFTGGDNGSHYFANLITFRTAGNQSVTATDTVNGSLTDLDNTDVAGGTPIAFTIAAPAQASAGQAFNADITAIDQWFNVASSYVGTVYFTATDIAATLPGDYTFTPGDQGQATVSITMATTGIQSVTATDTVDSGVNGTSNNITVGTSGVDYFEIQAPANANAGKPITVQVTAKDQFDNTVTNYYGTVTFTSTDNAAALPANYTFQVSDYGTRIFSLTLNTGLPAGTNQTIWVRDSTANTVTGNAIVNVLSGASLYSQPLLLTSYLSTALEYSYVYIEIESNGGSNIAFPVGTTYLEYDVFVPSSSASFYTGIDITGSGFVMRDYGQSTQSYIVDQNGIRSHASFNVGDYANGQWYHRRFDISAMVADYPTYRYIYLAQDTGNRGFNGAPSNRLGTFNAYYDNIRFTNSSGSTLQTVFADDDTLPRGGVSASHTTGTSWKGGTDHPENNFVYVTKNFNVYANPSSGIAADNSSVSHLSVTMTAANDSTAVRYALVDFYTNRLADTVDYGVITPELAPLTSSTGLAGANVKSTQAGSSQILFQAGPFESYLNVNFDASTASHVSIDPDSLSVLTNQSGLLTIQFEDNNNNFISDMRGVTMTSTSGTGQFSTDGSSWFSSILISPVTPVNLLFKDSVAHAVTITADADGLTDDTTYAVINNTPGDHLEVQPPSETITAGVYSVLTIQAKDSSDLNTYSTANVSITSPSSTMRFSTDEGSNWYTSDSFNLTNGYYHVWYYDTTAALGVTITATDNTTGMTAGVGYSTIVPAAASILTAWSSVSAVSPAGATAPITTKITDQYGNPVSGITVNYTATEQNGTASISPSSDVTDSNGEATSTLTTSTSAGNNYAISSASGLQSFTVTVSGSNQADEVLLLPNPFSIAADHSSTMYVRSIYTNAGQTYYAPPPSGSEDVLLYSTLHPTQGYTMEFSINGGGNWYNSVTVTLDAGGYAEVLLRNHYPETYTVTGQSATLVNDTDVITVDDGYFYRVYPVTAQDVFSGNTVAVTAQLVDQDGNSITTSGIAVTFSTTNGSLAPLTGSTDANGQVSTTLTTLLQNGTSHVVTVSSNDPNASDSSAVITTIPNISYIITAPGTAMQGWPFTFQVRVRDGYGSTVSNYTDVITFTSTDGTASLPSNYNFILGDAGVKIFSTTMNTQGSFTITGTDTGESTINGTSNTVLVGMAPTATFTRTATPTHSPTATSTHSPTASSTHSPTATPTFTATPSATPSGTHTSTATTTISPTATTTHTPTATITGTSTATITPTATTTHTPSATGTPTTTATPTGTPSDTPTITPSGTFTSTNTPTFTATGTATITVTPTATITATSTATITPTATNTHTPSATATPTTTATPTATSSDTPTITPSGTFTATATPTFTATASSTATITPTSTQTITPTSTPSATPTITLTTTPTITVTYTSTSTHSPTATATITPSATPSATTTGTLTFTVTPTITVSTTFTITSTATSTTTGTSTSTITPTSTHTITPTATSTVTGTYTATHSPTATPTNSPTGTSTATHSPTATSTHTPTATITPTSTNSATPTATVTNTSTVTGTFTATHTPTATLTVTDTSTMTASPTSTATSTVTPTGTPTMTASPTVTPTITVTHTPTSTVTSTFTSTSTYTPTITKSATPTITPTNTPTSTSTATSTITPTATPTATSTQTSTITLTSTSTASPTITPTFTSTPTITQTSTFTPTNTVTLTSTYTPTITLTATPTATLVSTATPTVTLTITQTTTPTATQTPFNTEIVVYPNPFNPNRAVGGVVKFDQLPLNTEISIYTVSGERVFQMTSQQIRETWDGYNSQGSPVVAGVYLYVIKPSNGNTITGKLFIVK